MSSVLSSYQVIPNLQVNAPIGMGDDMRLASQPSTFSPFTTDSTAFPIQNSQYSSQFNVAATDVVYNPLPNNIHANVNHGDFMFAIDYERNDEKNVTVVPLYCLNSEIQRLTLSRAKLSAKDVSEGKSPTYPVPSSRLFDSSTVSSRSTSSEERSRKASELKRKRETEKLIFEDLPLNVEQFRKTSKFFGVHVGATKSSFFDIRPGINASSHVRSALGMAGNMFVGNYWPFATAGDQVGFAAVMTTNLYRDVLDTNGAAVDQVKEVEVNEEYMQIVPVWRGNGVATAWQAVFPFRVSDDDPDNTNLFYWRYAPITNTIPPTEYTEQFTSLKSTKFTRILQLEEAHICPVGLVTALVMYPNVQSPYDLIPKVHDALRSRNGAIHLKSNFPVQINIRPSPV